MAVLGFGPGGSGGGGGAPPFTDKAEDKKSFDENWNMLEGKANVKSGGAAEKNPAIVLKGLEALLGLDLERIGLQFAPGALVSYEIQAKVKVDFDEGKDDYFITGISFRINGDASHSYGISFCKAYPGVSIQPASFDAVLEAAGIKNAIPHLILWVRDEASLTSPYRLLEYKPLELEDGIVETITHFIQKKPVTELRLKDWSTLVVKVDENFSGTGGTRQNHISAFISEAASYPRDTIAWPDHLGDMFSPVGWHASTQPIVDATITSEDQSTGDPEVGLHGFYDSKNEKEQFIDDFSFRPISGVAGSGGGAPGM
jgi:hypothetical protein